MPGRVTSIDVAPPNWIENPGINGLRIALIFLRFSKSGSHVFFSSSGACCPSADNVIWLPRSSIKSPQCFSALKPDWSSDMFKAG